MGKSRAEIQRAYREKKKVEEGMRYIEKERQRVQKYYIPIAERNTPAKRSRREKVRQYVREHRVRLRQQQINSGSINEETVASNANDENGVSSSTREILRIKLPAFDPNNRTRKRVSRATAQHHKELKKLKLENEMLKRRVKTVSKRNERLSKRMQNRDNKHVKVIKGKTVLPESAECSQTQNNLTPRKRVAAEIAEVGLTPSKVPKQLQETLLFAHVLADEINESRNENGQKGRRVIARVLSGKLVKKYKMKRRMNRMTGLNRKSVSSKKCDEVPQIRKRVKEREELQKLVYEFLLRDDNSRVMPGKNDKVKEGAQHRQKRVLNDSMKYMHLKFKSETEKTISFATFCRMRPKSISLTRYITKNQCLCQKHQNMALTLKAMKSAGVHVPINPDEYIRKLEETSVNEYTKDLSENIHHQQWKKVTLKDGKKRTKVVGKDVSREEFQTSVHAQTEEFKGHVARIKNQYKAMTNLKEAIENDSAIIQMDFAENFSCSTADEVQSAYWNSNAVTLHPVVVYYNENGNLKHINYVFVSDDMGHNIGAVYAILKRLIKNIKTDISQNLSKVYYWTDSPSSQYRNKTSSYLVSAHQELLGTKAEWNFWETGHGKGPCDGIGGTAKRMADLSVRQGKVTIQDGTDFFSWGKQHHKSAKYIYVTEDECNASRSEVDQINQNLTPLKGIMKVHQVFSNTKGIVNARVMSCYCDFCVRGNHHDFIEHTLLKCSLNGVRESMECENENPVSNDNHRNPTDGDNDGVQKITEDHIELAENDSVIALYDGKWHVGQVIEVDNDEQDCLVYFMRQTNARMMAAPTFKWPSPIDDTWVKFEDVLMKIREPTKIGRSGRSFSILEEEVKKIKQLFKSV